MHKMLLRWLQLLLFIPAVLFVNGNKTHHARDHQPQHCSWVCSGSANGYRNVQCHRRHNRPSAFPTTTTPCRFTWSFQHRSPRYYYSATVYVGDSIQFQPVLDGQVVMYEDAVAFRSCNTRRSQILPTGSYYADSNSVFVKTGTFFFGNRKYCARKLIVKVVVAPNTRNNDGVLPGPNDIGDRTTVEVSVPPPTPIEEVHSHGDFGVHCHQHGFSSCHCHNYEQILCPEEEPYEYRLYDEHIEEIRAHCYEFLTSKDDTNTVCPQLCAQPMEVLHVHYTECPSRRKHPIFTAAFGRGCHPSTEPEEAPADQKQDCPMARILPVPVVTTRPNYSDHHGHDHDFGEHCHAHPFGAGESSTCHCHLYEQILCPEDEPVGYTLYTEHIQKINMHCQEVRFGLFNNGQEQCPFLCAQPMEVLHVHYTECPSRAIDPTFAATFATGLCHPSTASSSLDGSANNCPVVEVPLVVAVQSEDRTTEASVHQQYQHAHGSFGEYCHAHPHRYNRRSSSLCHCHAYKEITCPENEPYGYTLYTEHIDEINAHCQGVLLGITDGVCPPLCAQPMEILHVHYDECPSRVRDVTYSRVFASGICHPFSAAAEVTDCQGDHRPAIRTTITAAEMISPQSGDGKQLSFYWRRLLLSNLLLAATIIWSA